MKETDKLLALRIDDIGASTKRYEVYSYSSRSFGKFEISANWLFLKYLPRYRKWGPYREMRTKEWETIYLLLEQYHAKLTVAVTASWAVTEKRLIPFPNKFPKQAAILREGLSQGLLEIANHGLTHCELKNNAFRPKWFSGNRYYHREFRDTIPREIHEQHIQRSQDILQQWFKTDIVTFVPPGNLFTDETVEIARRYGLRYLSCLTPRRIQSHVVIIGDEEVLPFHDRDIVYHGPQWLEAQLLDQQGTRFCFLRELGEHVSASLTNQYTERSIPDAATNQS